MVLDSFFTWLNERLESERFAVARRSGVSSSYGILSNRKPQKVEPNVPLIFVQGVAEPCFARFQFQSNAL